MVEASWPRESLIVAAQGGDPVAVAALVSDSHPHVQRFARALCASPEDAEDSAQEALIVLYRKIGTLRASGALVSWMFRIVRNECLRRVRRALRGDVLVRLDTTVSAEDDVIQRLEAQRVAAAVAELPADQRRVLIMRDIQGYSGRAVAAALGLSTPAMKSRLYRARATVRQLLQDPSPLAQHDR